jgi:hypothetical protein
MERSTNLTNGILLIELNSYASQRAVDIFKKKSAAVNSL